MSLSEIVVRNMNNEIVDQKIYPRVVLRAGRTVTGVSEFKPVFPSNGYYAVEYCVR